MYEVSWKSALGGEGIGMPWFLESWIITFRFMDVQDLSRSNEVWDVQYGHGETEKRRTFSLFVLSR